MKMGSGETTSSVEICGGEGKTGGLECDMSGKRTRPWCVVEVESWRHGVSNDGYYQSYSGWWWIGILGCAKPESIVGIEK
jgi:hypothetical protein